MLLGDTSIPAQGKEVTRKPHVIIAGAGIGGLTAALALLRKGFDVDLYEQAPGLAEIGAGLQISANGSRILCALGLDDASAAAGCEPAGKQIRLWNTGRTWKLFDLGAESVERYGYPRSEEHTSELQSLMRKSYAVFLL